MTKADLRRRMQTVLDGLEARDLAERSAAVARRLAATAAWRAADLVLAFLSMPGELDTAPLIAAAYGEGKAVAVPRIEGDRIRFHLMPADHGPLPRDRWGIPVPDPSWPALPSGSSGAGTHAASGSLLIVVPGLAFDRQGNRLGRGRGFYDRFLAEADAAWGGRVATIAVCLAEQVVDSVPTGVHDRPVGGVVTDAESLLFPPSLDHSPRNM